MNVPDYRRFRITVEEMLNMAGEDAVWQKQEMVVSGRDAADLLDLLAEIVRRQARSA